MSNRSLTVSELQSYLEDHLVKTKAKNPRYTASALAKQLGMHDSTMHKILRGERQLGYRLAKDIAAHFDLTVVQERQTKKRRLIVKELQPDSDIHTSWVHLAILELIKLKDFKPEAPWIATRLGLKTETVNEILDEMERGQVLARLSSGWVDLLENASTQSTGFLSTARVRNVQKEILALSLKAIDEIDYEEREHQMSLVPIPKSLIPQLKQKIRKFTWDLCEMAQTSHAPKDEVYALQIGLFPVTRNGQTGDKN